MLLLAEYAALAKLETHINVRLSDKAENGKSFFDGMFTACIVSSTGSLFF